MIFQLIIIEKNEEQRIVSLHRIKKNITIDDILMKCVLNGFRGFLFPLDMCTL